jgi:hypothetical protein
MPEVLCLKRSFVGGLHAACLLAAVPPASAQFPVCDEALFLGPQVQDWKRAYPVAYLVSRPQLLRDKDVDALTGKASVPGTAIPLAAPSGRPGRPRRPGAVPS